jgi:hypothetical protein
MGGNCLCNLKHHSLMLKAVVLLLPDYRALGVLHRTGILLVAGIRMGMVYGLITIPSIYFISLMNMENRNGIAAPLRTSIPLMDMLYQAAIARAPILRIALMHMLDGHRVAASLLVRASYMAVINVGNHYPGSPFLCGAFLFCVRLHLPALLPICRDCRSYYQTDGRGKCQLKNPLFHLSSIPKRLPWQVFCFMLYVLVGFFCYFLLLKRVTTKNLHVESPQTGFCSSFIYLDFLSGSELNIAY